MKLGWRFESEPNKLWARVPKDKYCKGHDLERLGTRKNISNAWQDVMETLKLTKKGVGHRIGDGRGTKFWLHKWVDGKTLISQAIKEVLDEQPAGMRILDA